MLQVTTPATAERLAGTDNSCDSAERFEQRVKR